MLIISPATSFFAVNQNLCKAEKIVLNLIMWKAFHIFQENVGVVFPSYHEINVCHCLPSVVCPCSIFLNGEHQARKQHVFSKVLSMTRMGFKPLTAKIQSRHSNHYATEFGLLSYTIACFESSNIICIKGRVWKFDHFHVNLMAICRKHECKKGKAWIYDLGGTR